MALGLTRTHFLSTLQRAPHTLGRAGFHSSSSAKVYAKFQEEAQAYALVNKETETPSWQQGLSITGGRRVQLPTEWYQTRFSTDWRRNIFKISQRCCRKDYHQKSYQDWRFGTGLKIKESEKISIQGDVNTLEGQICVRTGLQYIISLWGHETEYLSLEKIKGVFKAFNYEFIVTKDLKFGTFRLYQLNTEKR